MSNNVIPLPQSVQMVLICSCQNKSFFVYDDGETVECVQCGNTYYHDFKFMADQIERDYSTPAPDTKPVKYVNISAQVFAQRLASIDKTDEILVAQYITRSGVIASYRHPDVSETLGRKVHRNWVRRRLKQLYNLALSP